MKILVSTSRGNELCYDSAGFRVSKGDKVELPALPWMEDSWDATVLGTGYRCSPFKGALKPIVGVWRNGVLVTTPDAPSTTVSVVPTANQIGDNEELLKLINLQLENANEVSIAGVKYVRKTIWVRA